MNLKATISGSYRKFHEELEDAIQAFKDCNVEVLSPKSGKIVSHIDGFVALEGDLITRIDMIADNYLSEAMKTIENSHLRAIQSSDLLWLVIRDGYFGESTAFEIGWALSHNIPVYYSSKEYDNVKEPIIKCYATPVKSIEFLVNNFNPLTAPKVDPAVSRRLLYNLSGTTEKQDYEGVAVGGVITNDKGEILVVKTGTWGEQYTLVGGRIKKRANLGDSLKAIVKEQIGVDCEIGKIICAFNELPDSGFYVPDSSRIFIDSVVRISDEVKLNKRLDGYEFKSPKKILKLAIEKNAWKTLITYLNKVA